MCLKHLCYLAKSIYEVEKIFEPIRFNPKGKLQNRVFIGVIIAALVFTWDNAKRIRARKYTDERGVKHYEIYGPLFFASVAAFNEKFDILNDPDEVIIDFAESRVVDMSAIEALNKLTERYHKLGKKILIKHLSADCRQLLHNADQIIDVNVIEDPSYKPRICIRTSIPAQNHCEIGRSYISFIQHNSSIMPHSGNARFLCAFDPHNEVLMHSLG